MKPEVTGSEINNEKSQIHKLEGTPFHVLEKNNTFTLLTGVFTLTKPMESMEAIKNYVEKDYWHLIVSIATVVAYYTTKEIQRQENEEMALEIKEALESREQN